VSLLFLAGYAGLTSLQLNGIINDKLLHFLTFFLLTTCFYWILDTSRRRNTHFTLIVCTAVLGVGSEFLQSIIPNGREFDLYDIVANIAGSLAGLGLSTWYHKRMLDRKRQARAYHVVPNGDIDGEHDHDVELGEGMGLGAQEEGIVHTDVAPAAVSLEEELDNWDENAEDDDWDADEQTATNKADGDGKKTTATTSGGEGDAEDVKPVKKRAD
jgi:VanZ family protein